MLQYCKIGPDFASLVVFLYIYHSDYKAYVGLSDISILHLIFTEINTNKQV